MHTPFMAKQQQSPHRRGTAGGRLKQRLARILTRSTCTTNATAACSSGGTTAFVSLAKTTTNANADSSHREPEPEAPPSPYFCTPCTYDRPNLKKVLDAGTRPRHHHRRHRRTASLVHISVDCTGGATSGRRSSIHSDAPLLLHHHLSVPARDVVKKPSKGRNRSRSGKPPAAAARSPSASRRWHGSSSSSSWGRARRPRPTSSSGTPTPAYSYSWSSSSSSSGSTGGATDDDELAPFSCSDEEEERGGDDGEAETRTLFSSRSFSSDSTSEFYNRHATTNNGGSTSRRRNNRVNNKQMTSRRSRRAPPRRALSRATSSHDPAPAPAPVAYFRPVVSVETKTKRRECNERKKEEMGRLDLNDDAVKKKVMATMGGSAGAAAAAEEEETMTGGAGTAVVKRSSNPYLDFRSSMVEMVVERRIGSVGKMEELLGSYLSLNSPRHHPAILAAFEDVWEAVFGEE